MLTLARAHVKRITEVADGFGQGFDLEHCGLTSIRWRCYEHTQSRADLQLSANARLQSILGLPHGQVLHALAKLEPACAKDHLLSEIRANIDERGIDGTVICAFYNQMQVDEFFRLPPKRLQKRADDLFAYISEKVFWSAE